MASRFKVSKFRNAVVKQAKREGWYSEVVVGTPSTDADHIRASAKFIAFSWDSIGAVAVIPLEKTGKMDRSMPLIRGHSDFISDFDFSPFNDNLLATGSNDQSIAIWNIPEGGLTESLSSPNVRISANGARVESLRFNPSANSVLAGACGDTVKIFDIEKGQSVLDLAGHHTEGIFSLSWKSDGSIFATTCKDRKVRIIDPRAASVASSGEGHAGIKTSRVVWAGNHDRIITTGFSKSRERQYGLWDTRNMASSLSMQSLDSSTGVLMPFYDEDINILVLAGKGDSLLRYYEVGESSPYYTEGTANIAEPPQTGATLVPKRALNVMECETWRVLKLTKDAVIPVSYEIPRKSHRDFQEDLFPETKSTSPGTFAEKWFAGENGEVTKTSLDPTKGGKVQVAPKPQPAPSAALAAANTATVPSVASASAAVSSPAHAPSSSTASPPPPQQQQKQQQESAPAPVSLVNSEKAIKAQNIVRSSKYRHVQGTPLHKKNNIDSITHLNAAIPGECNLFIANEKFCAVPLNGAGGQLAIVKTDFPTRLPPQVPSLQNVSPPTDYAFDPFDPCKIAVALEDGSINIWQIPANGLTDTLTTPELKLTGHDSKVNIVKFHPTARNLVASASSDCTIRYWDISKGGDAVLVIKGQSEPTYAFDFSEDGKTLATLSKDRQLRIYDARTGAVSSETLAYEGTRGGRVQFLGKTGLIATTGFDKSSTRQVKLFQQNPLTEIACHNLDVSPGILTTFYDPDTTLLYVSGRGDTSILTFEIDAESAPFLHPATPFKASEPQQGVAFLSKAVCNVSEVEVARAVKLNKTHIEFIQFQIPRTRKEFFQDDLFPETLIRNKTDINASEWLAGKDASQKYIDLKPANMIALSQAPKEQPKQRKFASYNPAVEDSPEQKKEKLLNAIVDQLGDKKNTALPQDNMQGVEESEWD